MQELYHELLHLASTNYIVDLENKRIHGYSGFVLDLNDFNNSKYDKIKSNLSMYDRLELETMRMPLWNGKDCDVISWEFHFKITLEQLYNDINY